jgi:hypothetical protein
MTRRSLSSVVACDIDANWKLVKENSHGIGDFTWTGWNYLGEAGIGAQAVSAGGSEIPRRSHTGHLESCDLSNALVIGERFQEAS